MFVFLLFFKQKTAYEMRISDWSSDVCSSDLPRHVMFSADAGREGADCLVFGGAIEHVGRGLLCLRHLVADGGPHLVGELPGRGPHPAQYRPTGFLCALEECTTNGANAGRKRNIREIGRAHV